MTEMSQLMNRFVEEDGYFFYISPEGTRHRITNVYIIANGVGDLCLIKGSNQGEVHVKQLCKANKEDIVMVPTGDILWMNVDPPYNDAKSIAIDVGSDKENVKPMIKAMLKSPKANTQPHGDLYDAYGGDDYWDDN